MCAFPLLTVLLIAPAPSVDIEAASLAAESFFAAAVAKDETAFQAACSPDLERSDAVLLGTMYEVLSSAPFEVDYPDPALINGARALSAFQLRSSLDAGGATPTSWLWLERSEEGNWHVSRLDQDQRYSREWLYETPKQGLAADPAGAARTLFDAMQAGERHSAERACSDLAWAGSTEGLALLYQTTQDVGLRFRFEQAQIAGERAVVSFGLDYGDEAKTSAQLLVERRGAGWLATGFDKDNQHTQAFLEGRVSATQDPLSPFVCIERLTAAINGSKSVRLRRLTAAKMRAAHPGISLYLGLARRGGKVSLPRGGLETFEQRGVARMQIDLGGADTTKNTLWLIELRPEGWRLVGETEIPDRAAAFLDPTSVEPR